MANVFEFEGFRPVIHESAFVHPNATVTGNVIIGRDVYVGPGAAIRGDWGGVVIEDGCNLRVRNVRRAHHIGAGRERSRRRNRVDARSASVGGEQHRSRH